MRCLWSVSYTHLIEDFEMILAALITSLTHHNIIVKLCIPCSQDHFKIFDGIVPHFNIVRYGVLKQDNVLIYHSQGAGRHIPVYL